MTWTFPSRGGVRNNELTENRVIGKVCASHPELNGMRVRNMAGNPGVCIGCERERQRKVWAAKQAKKVKQEPKRKKIRYGDSWKNLQDAMWGLGG